MCMIVSRGNRRGAGMLVLAISLVVMARPYLTEVRGEATQMRSACHNQEGW